ncbi:response regulator [Mariprofundus ferrooxydans]|nr:response regulator [Mariprofundus ferrooxydans]
MHQTIHSLNHTMTKTLIFWGAAFCILLTLVFAFIFNAMADRPIPSSLLSATEWAILFIFLLISIKLLHTALTRKLIQPLENLLQNIDNQELDNKAMFQFEHDLPNETDDIQAAYDDLKHSHDDLKTQMSSIMQSLSHCFWWSNDGTTYASISEKSKTIINQSPTDIQGSELWAWTQDSVQINRNNNRLRAAIKRHDEKLDIAYQIQHDDQLHWYGESITLAYDSEGNIDTVYGVINDINRRKNKQQQQSQQLELEHRMEATGTLVGGIAHEFNNILAGMNGNVFLIKQSNRDEKTLLRIERIESLIERSAGMIDSMLCFAKKSNIRPTPLSLLDFLKRIQPTLLPSLTHNVHIKLQYDETIKPDEYMILADKNKLQEAILQLASNANAALANISPAELIIGLEKVEADDALLQKHPRLSSRQLIHCSFHDNGCGISDDIKTHVFEPFFTTREVGQGTGLGLSMVYGYINQIGGAIELESSIDVGTTFHIYFPCCISSPSTSLPDTFLIGNGEKILIVDDDKIFRESTCEVLQRMGYQTIQARDGTESIELFQQHRDSIGLVFMDILMPGINGIQASKEIRRISATVPIIYLTGYDHTEPMDAEVYAEHAELINKPFRISVLSQVIQKSLKKTNPEQPAPSSPA